MILERVEWSDSPVNVPGISKSRYRTEIAFQIYCADWLRKRFELTGDDRFQWFHHSANERQGAFAGMIAKLMGQAKGFPDFISPQLKIAIELKLPGRKASDQQMKWLEHFGSIGWTAEVVFSFERFAEIVMSKINRAE